ncbi:FHA domain-containing protein [Calothrix sp. PCC 6303]|uniref:FHA domain-containing protein n=1 Tax=Calothrix sp. PCC 6303 TaxID=1170562 RepID=UPI0002A00CE9|nr:FHA domain-containing protein [Calothrix sp. PCC 6303]AFY99927.1 FHA domain containing protein [Calothrix sp. PCC 6303]
MVEFLERKLEQQLYLYQSFLKIYEHHSSLLDEILQLENPCQPSFGTRNDLYIEGVVNDSTISLVTNLWEDQTITLRQSQQIWTLGRDRINGIHIDNPYVSRYHAMIRFSEDEQSFYLVDLNSTNGSFINGERVYQPTKLKESDRIRLGTLTFSFFLNTTTKFLPDISVKLLIQSNSEQDADVKTFNYSSPKTRILDEQADDTLDMLHSIGVMNQESPATSISKLLNVEPKSEILDYFLGK